MKKILFVWVILTLALSNVAIGMDFGQHHVKVDASGPNGPAPNSGDGIPDGSGNNAPFGPNNGD